MFSQAVAGDFDKIRRNVSVQKRSVGMRLLLEGFPASGQRVKDYCQRHGLSIWQFQYWRRRLGFRFRKRRGLTGFSPAISEPPATFVRVIPDIVPPLAPTGWGFEVSFPSGAIFRGTEALALKGLERLSRLGR